MQDVKLNEPARILSIDVLRGVSLFGIFLVNMLSFHSPYFYYNPYEWWKTPGELLAFSWIDVFVQASFYPLFAAMFGFGVAMQREKALKNGSLFWKTGMRRFAFLLVLGFLHAVLIWPGDILFNYAVCGFVLLLFLRFSGRLLVLAGLAFWFMPAFLLSALLMLAARTDPYNAFFWTDISSVSQSIAAYGSGSFREVTIQRWHDWTNNNIRDGAFLFQFIGIFPFLLIGAGLFKLRFLEKWTAQPGKTFRLFCFLAAAGLLLKSIPHFGNPSHTGYMYVQDAIGGPVLAAAYALLVVFICTQKPLQQAAAFFAEAGKMSLTNYLLQSLAGSLVFYSYGLGFYGQITVTTGILLCAAFFVLQVAASGFWLSRFRHGPVEYVWRKAMYGKEKNK